jgi:hypothetical protein
MMGSPISGSPSFFLAFLETLQDRFWISRFPVNSDVGNLTEDEYNNMPAQPPPPQANPIDITMIEMPNLNFGDSLDEKDDFDQNFGEEPGKITWQLTEDIFGEEPAVQQMPVQQMSQDIFEEVERAPEEQVNPCLEQEQVEPPPAMLPQADEQVDPSLELEPVGPAQANLEEEPDRQIDIIAEVEPQAEEQEAEQVDPSLELEPVEPPRAKRRRVKKLAVDKTPQIDMEVIRGHAEWYADNIKTDLTCQDLHGSPAAQILFRPGRRFKVECIFQRNFRKITCQIEYF